MLGWECQRLEHSSDMDHQLLVIVVEDSRSVLCEARGVLEITMQQGGNHWEFHRGAQVEVTVAITKR